MTIYLVRFLAYTAGLIGGFFLWQRIFPNDPSTAALAQLVTVCLFMVTLLGKAQ